MKQGCISKAELAMAYRPDATVKVAENYLSQQIQSTPGLLEALTKVGYRKCQKMFTPKQIEVIYDMIGAP